LVALSALFEQRAPLKILVAGDLLLDRYTIGSTRRISPESPVPVVNVTREEQRPGGAGNVMLNLRGLGANVVALGRVGADPAGEQLQEELRRSGIDTKLIVTDSIPTPVKQRIMAQGQQLVRVDREVVRPLGALAEKQLIEAIPDVIEWCQVVTISDYAKGTLSDTVLSTLIFEARRRGIPVVVDPKGLDYQKYEGATLIKPNLAEAYAVTGADDNTAIGEVATRLAALVKTDALMITRSGEGISLWQDGEEYHSAARVREVVDVTGAGDTVLATLAIGLGSGLSLADSTDLANIAAGLAVERVGCACVRRKEIAEQVLLADATSKFVDSRHLPLLREALHGSDLLVVLVDTRQGFDQTDYQAVRQAKTKGTTCVICCIDESPCTSVLDLLSSLREVDYLAVASEELVEGLAPSQVLRLDCALTT